MRTAGLPVAWALRMRVNISAMGSVMLMIQFLACASISAELPAGLAQARHVAAHGRFAQLVATEAEFSVDTVRAAGNGAARGLAAGAGVARQLLQFRLGLHLLVIRGFGVQHDRLELGTLAGVPLGDLGPLDLAVDH